jgi:excisionase family DNA binding protein
MEYHKEGRLMGKKSRSPVTKGPVGNKIDRRDISQEPGMKQLKELFSQMTEDERARTIEYLSHEGEDQGRGEASPLLLTPKEAAAFLKVSVITLAKWRGKKSGPAYTRTGRTIKYTRQALEEFLQKNAVSN